MKKLNLKQWLFLFLSLAIFVSACDEDEEPIVTDFNAELSVSTNGNESELNAIEFTVTLSATNSTGEVISFDFNIIDGTAIVSEDYTELADSVANLKIENGAATGSITVNLIQDTKYENTETVIGQITNPSYDGVTITMDQATANIEDDDIYANGVFITNEGAFGAGNGSVSYYSYNENTLTNEIFKSVNDRALGDVVQSLTVYDGKAYIVVNASNKVEVVQSNDFIEQGVITDVTSPRYFIGINNDKGYVTQWGEEGVVKVIDLDGLAVTKTITVGAGPEHLIYHNDYVYVANSGGYANDNTISVINPSTDEVVKTITLDGDSPRDFAIDTNGDLWVLCYGYIEYDYTDWSIISETASKLIRINPITNEVAQTITISDNQHPSCLESSQNGNNLFYGGGYGYQGIYKMDITATSVPTTPLLDKYFYGFNINSETGNIFALEAPTFTANGTLWRYDANGTELGSYEAGVGPNGASTKRLKE